MTRCWRYKKIQWHKVNDLLRIANENAHVHTRMTRFTKSKIDDPKNVINPAYVNRNSSAMPITKTSKTDHNKTQTRHVHKTPTKPHIHHRTTRGKHANAKSPIRLASTYTEKSLRTPDEQKEWMNRHRVRPAIESLSACAYIGIVECGCTTCAATGTAKLWHACPTRAALWKPCHAQRSGNFQCRPLDT